MSNQGERKQTSHNKKEIPDDPAERKPHEHFLHALRNILNAKKEDVDDLTKEDDEKPDYNKKFKLP